MIVRLTKTFNLLDFGRTPQRKPIYLPTYKLYTYIFCKVYVVIFLLYTVKFAFEERNRFASLRESGTSTYILGSKTISFWSEI